jgi:hypothetical protein
MKKPQDLGWMDRGNCRPGSGVTPDDFVFDPSNIRKKPYSKALDYKIEAAKAVCRGCSVRSECGDYASKTGSVGIFGGELHTRIKTPQVIRKREEAA